MSSPLPLDPYHALGVARDATAAEIKKVYRQLVLKCHPDKVSDPAQKQTASDQFHKIQSAYEIVSDEDRRGRYDAEVRLAELRKGLMQERAATSAKADSRRPAPHRSYTYASRSPDRSGRIYEERRPSDVHAHAYAYADYTHEQAQRATARKDEHYERQSSKRSPPRDDRERAKAASRATKEAERARAKERSSKRDKDIKRERETKYEPSVRSVSDDEDDDDAYSVYDSHSRRRAEDDHRSRDAYYEQPRRQRDATPRRQYAYEDVPARSERLPDYEARESDAREYMTSSRSRQHERGPSPERVSSRDKLEYVRDSKGRTFQIRRGSGKPQPATDIRPKVQDVADDERPRRPPTLNQSYSTPDGIRIPKLSADKPRASSIDHGADHDREFEPPRFRRAETMPTQPSSRKSSVPLKTSNLRRTEMNHGQLTPDATPIWEPMPENTRQPYREDYEYPYRTEIREPSAKLRSTSIPQSPSPSLDRERDQDYFQPPRDRGERQRPASSRTIQPERPTIHTQRTMSSHHYAYNETQRVVEEISPRSHEQSSRPPMTRESSGNGMLYGEVPKRSERSSPIKQTSKYSPPPVDRTYRRDEGRPPSSSNQHSRRSHADERPPLGRSSGSYRRAMAY